MQRLDTQPHRKTMSQHALVVQRLDERLETQPHRKTMSQHALVVQRHDERLETQPERYISRHLNRKF